MPPRLLMFLALGLLAPAGAPVAAPPAVTFIEGYAWPVSVAPGDTVGIYVSTDAATFDLEVVRRGLDRTPVLTQTGIPGLVQTVPAESAWAGCDWQLSGSVVVPPEWSSGVYAADLKASNYTGHAVFVVREAAPGATARILFECSVNTWQAYNTWGGKCLYDFISTGGNRANVVSFKRPYSAALGLGQFSLWEEGLVAWLEREGYAVAYCTDLDVHADPSLLTPYDLLLVVGHNEYWSKGMRDNVEAWIGTGGNVAVFGGDTCWWQIRYSSELDQVICYKSAALDPLNGTQDSLVTVAWPDPPVLRPGNTMIGASRLHGGYPDSTGDGNYVVEQAAHWIFTGTGLSNGDEFGGGYVVGVEVDGADFVRQNGIPVPTGSDGTPPGFRILATAPSTNGSATMGLLRSNRAAVFNGASMTWAAGVNRDPVTARITENVLSGLVAGDPFESATEDIVLDALHWGSTGGTVQVSLTFRNANAGAPSRGIHGAIEGRTLGSLLDAGAPVVGFDLPSIPAGQSVTEIFALSKATLPASAARLLPGGAPVPGCQEDTSWAGGITARWRVTGVPDSIALRRDVATVRICPGGGFHHVQVAWSCAGAGGVSWIMGSAPGWSTDLVVDNGGVPGGTAPDPVPSGAFTGWIAVAADSTVPAGTESGFTLQLTCGTENATVEVEASACACLDPTGAPVSASPTAALRVGADGANPSVGETGIRLELPIPGRARLAIHDVRGRLLWTRDLGPLPAGTHRTAWDGRDRSGARLPAGVYFLRLVSGDAATTGKLVLLD